MLQKHWVLVVSLQRFCYRVRRYERVEGVKGHTGSSQSYI